MVGIDYYRKTSIISSFCSKYGISSYEIMDDLSVNTHGHVKLGGLGLKSIPIKFGISYGDFTITNNNLRSLENSPSIVHGSFLCDYNRLKSLEHCPKEIHGNFNFHNNSIETFQFSPIVKGRYLISQNPIKSLLGIHPDQHRILIDTTMDICPYLYHFSKIHQSTIIPKEICKILKDGIIADYIGLLEKIPGLKKESIDLKRAHQLSKAFHIHKRLDGIEIDEFGDLP